MSSVRRHADVVIAAAAGLMTALMLAGNIGRSFDFDESVAVWTTIRRGSATVPFTETAVFNTHPIFSSWQSVWWDLGGMGEARQRIFPVLYGALAVALLAGWVARRLGPRAGIAAGLVLGLNPMFVSQARAVRGYSLAILGIVLAVVCVLEYVRHDDRRSRSAGWLLAGHALWIVLAVGTHAVSVVVLGSIGLAALLLLARVDGRLVLSWVVAGAGVALVYGWTISELLNTADSRGSRYLESLGEQTFEEVLGRDPITIAIHGGLVVVAVLAFAMADPTGRARSFPASVLIAGLVIAQFFLLWQVVQPYDLYPRFFLGAVPLVAIAVAFAVRHHGPMLLLVAIAAGFVVDDVRSVRTAEVPLRDVGDVVVAADALDLRLCAVGTEAMLPYLAGIPVQEVEVPNDPAAVDFGDCEVYVRVGGWGRPLDGIARERFEHEIPIGGLRVFATVPPDQLGR